MSTTIQMPIVLLARSFAFEVHLGQVRGGMELPMVYHLEEVARFVEIAGGSAYQIAAGWLHDVIEDTPVTLAEIMRRFGSRVGNIVDGLTDPPQFANLPTLERKALQALRLKSESGEIKVVKYSDVISNLRTVAKNPPKVWSPVHCRDYIEGSRLLATECVGISAVLDELFQKAFAEALRVYP